MSVQLDLEAIDPESLTEKQALVFEGLLKDKPVTTIAKQMKITPAGVYGHIRALNRIARNVAANGDSEPAASSNGDSAQNEATENGANSTPNMGGFEAAVETVQQSLVAEKEVLTQSQVRIADATKLIEDAQAAIQAEQEEISRRATRIEALESARETLVAA